MMHYKKYLVDRVCEKCKRDFKAYKYNVLKGWGRFCSWSCSKKDQRNRLGIPVSTEQKEKISITLKRKYASGELKSPLVTMGITGKCGKDAPNWRGGKTLIGQNIRRSKKYRDWRMKVLIRDYFTCKFCKVRGGKLHVDHIKPFAYFPKLIFRLTNARTLCIPCHRKTPTWGAQSAKL